MWTRSLPHGGLHGRDQLDRCPRSTQSSLQKIRTQMRGEQRRQAAGVGGADAPSGLKSGDGTSSLGADGPGTADVDTSTASLDVSSPARPHWTCV